MPKSDYTTVGVIGSAKASEELVAAELDNFLPDDLDQVVIPAKIARRQAGLRNVTGWLTKELGEDGFFTDDDVIGVLKAAQAEGEKVALVVLLAEDDDADRDTVVAALDAGIPCFDLTQGMDEIKVEEDEPAEEPKDEPETKPQRRTRRTRGKDTEEPAEDSSAPRRRKRRSEPEGEIPGQTAIDDEPPFDPPYTTVGADPDVAEKMAEVEAAAEEADEAQNTVEVLRSAQEVSGLSTEALAAFIDARLARLFHDLALTLTGVPGKQGPTSASASTSEQEPTFTFLLSEDNEYKLKGRGRPRRGSVEKQLTLSEVKELGLEALLNEK